MPKRNCPLQKSVRRQNRESGEGEVGTDIHVCVPRAKKKGGAARKSLKLIKGEKGKFFSKISFFRLEENRKGERKREIKMNMGRDHARKREKGFAAVKNVARGTEAVSDKKGKGGP